MIGLTFDFWTVLDSSQRKFSCSYWLCRCVGRGIKVCERWQNDFSAFEADIGPRPSPQHSIDRTDNSKGYGPDNCRWATRLEQTLNRDLTLRDVDGKAISEIATETGINYQTIHNRYEHGARGADLIRPVRGST